MKTKITVKIPTVNPKTARFSDLVAGQAFMWVDLDKDTSTQGLANNTCWRAIKVNQSECVVLESDNGVPYLEQVSQRIRDDLVFVLDIEEIKLKAIFE